MMAEDGRLIVNDGRGLMVIMNDKLIVIKTYYLYH